MAKKQDRYAEMPFNQQRILKHKQEDVWVVEAHKKQSDQPETHEAEVTA